jgi:hypothetical protein
MYCRNELGHFVARKKRRISIEGRVGGRIFHSITSSSTSGLPTMLPGVDFPIRTECPPGACICDRERLLAEPGADLRILKLTREEEKKLLARIEAISSYEDLRGMQQKMVQLLGIALTITPSANEVRTVRGFHIELGALPGLCRKTRQSIPAAVRKCLDQHPEIAFAILDAHDLFGMDQR